MSIIDFFKRSVRPVHCSFCGFANFHKDVHTIIAGPGVFICDICIDACKTIVDEQRGKNPELEKQDEPV